jgi:hypothetical protein
MLEKGKRVWIKGSTMLIVAELTHFTGKGVKLGALLTGLTYFVIYAQNFGKYMNTFELKINHLKIL